MSKALRVLSLIGCVLGCSRNNGVDVATKRGLASADAALSGLPTRKLAAGTTITATIQRPLSSQSDTVGEPVNAIVSLNVMDDGRQVVIPGGSAITLTISRLAPAATLDAIDGVIALDLKSMMVGGTTYSPTAITGDVSHTLRRRDTKRPDRDVIVSAGTPISITLTQPFRIPAR
jgi:hypothetical protein